MRLSILAITLGDINGIGPEVVLKALYGHRWPRHYRFVLIGSRRVVEAQSKHFALPMPDAWSPDEGEAPQRKVVLWDPSPRARLTWRPGKMQVAASKAASEWIHLAVARCLDRTFGAMVTAPICKKGFHLAGITVPGHTELLAALTRRRRYAMMLLGGGLRVVIVTRHIPLSEVASRLTRADISTAIKLTGQALPWLGLRKRRIGVCGLNPHAGEGGDMGDEEARLITPSIRAAQRAGFKASGPIPSDVIFYQAVHGQHDAVVAMYHDQGLAPLKMLAFEKGVNLTLGLPIVRTSPDHGTAFDIAGQGVANPSSTVEALRLAGVLAGKRNPWGR